MATSGKNETLGFPTLKWEEEEQATRPMPLHELPRQVGIDNAMAIIAKRHERIAKAITVFWGSQDCVDYMEKLVMSGGDGFGNSGAVGHHRQHLRPAAVVLHEQTWPHRAGRQDAPDAKRPDRLRRLEERRGVVGQGRDSPARGSRG